MNERHIDEVSNFFLVKFPQDEQINRDMLTIPARTYIETDDAWKVRATSARHLLAFAKKWDIEYPESLEWFAGMFHDHDTLEVLPKYSPNCIDLNKGETLVFRTAGHQSYEVHQILRRITGVGQLKMHAYGRSGYGWNDIEGYWELPVGLITSRTKDIISLLNHGFLATAPAWELIEVAKRKARQRTGVYA